MLLPYKILTFATGFAASGLFFALLMDSPLIRFWAGLMCITGIVRTILELFEISQAEEEEGAEVETEHSEVPKRRKPSRKELKDRVRIPSTMVLENCTCSTTPELKYDEATDGFYLECPSCHKKTIPNYYLVESVIEWNRTVKEASS